jgi:poly(3-hydroxybutyrate) depolymerase/protein-S-isoprenylcysteine O-methyltransferase Ste14
MRRVMAVGYGLIGYLAFLVPIGYLFGFLADLWVPKSVDRGAGPLGPSLWIDVGLLVAFGLQHSVMARPAFKAWLRRWVPDGLERSTYTLASGIVLGALFWLWRPIPAVLWDVHGTVLEGLAWAGYATGWGLGVWATFAISHFHLFGVMQATAYGRGREHPRMVLRTSVLYRIVRHPMTAGLLLAFWSTPRMTLGHLLFAAGMTAYSLIGTVLEERTLLRDFPEAYRRYRREVPALIPVLRPGLVLPRRAGLGTELGLTALGAGIVSFGILGAPVGASGVPDAPRLDREETMSGGRERSYAFFDPSPGDPRPRPLVLALHGTGGSAARIQHFLGGELERGAGERGWLVAYPEAFAGAWNDCRRGLRAPSRVEGVDDVAFLRAVIGRLAAERRADPDRVFLLGYSGGGHMAFRVALEAPGLVRAVAVFGASLPTDDALACEVRQGATNVLVVNGTRDLVNPFGGGEVITPTGVPLGPVRSSRATAAFFERRGEALVSLRIVPGGGHAVPGPASRFPAMVGPTVRTFSGVQEALTFFAGH